MTRNTSKFLIRAFRHGSVSRKRGKNEIMNTSAVSLSSGQKTGLGSRKFRSESNRTLKNEQLEIRNFCKS